jgi:hypothetical protein
MEENNITKLKLQKEQVIELEMQMVNLYQVSANTEFL